MAYVHTRVRWTSKDQTAFPWAAIVTSNYFSLLGVKAVMGRTLLPGVDTVGRASVVAVVSDQFWIQQLAANRNVLGKPLIINDHAFTIVGVLPKHFEGVDLAWGGIPDIYIPVSMQSVALPGGSNSNLLQLREARIFLVMGRLKPSVGLKEARAETKVVANQLAEAYPVADKGRTTFVLTASESRMWPGWRESVVHVLTLLIAAAGFVLLVACANVANLLLTRAFTRQREMALRLALGSSRGRIIRQLLTESILLALIGTTGGLLFAHLLIKTAPSFQLTPRMHMNFNLRLDDRVFFLTLLLSLLAALIFGLIPAFTASQVNLTEALKETAHHSSIGAGSRRVRDVIIGIEVAFAFLCLIGGSLFVRSLLRLENVDLGFDARSILATTLFLPSSHYSSTQGSRFYAQLLDRVSSLAGVKGVCLTEFRPLTTVRVIKHIVPQRLEGQNEAAGVQVQTNDVSPGYFRTLSIPLLRGRDFTPRDTAQTPLVVITNQTLARKIWPHENPIGKLLKFQNESSYRQVIGIVSDIKYHTAWEGPEPYIYLPLAQNYTPEVSLLVRTKTNPMSFLPEVQQSIDMMDRTVPLFDVQTLDEQLKYSLSQPRVIARLLALFAAIALLLAITGIYAVVSYSVSHRTREVGIRLALGAQRADVLKLIIGRVMLLAMAGIGSGIIASLGVSRLMAGLLYGVKPTDMLTFLGVSAVLAGVALLAAYIPARRATKIDPLRALRYE